MKLCPDCHSAYSFSEEACPLCGFRPVMHDGFPAYAPELNRGEHAFAPEAYQNLAESEEGSFWFQARNRLIISTLATILKGRERGDAEKTAMLEIGCGTGFVLTGIRGAFPELRLCGSEISTDGLAFAAQRLPEIPLMQMDARQIPFVQEFDVIGAFDVLEHVREDEEVMNQVHAALKPEGFFIVTVPQHMWLWSATDKKAKHFRRYSAPELHGKLEKNGFRVVSSTSFVSLLLPFLLLSRKFSRKQNVGSELLLPAWINTVCSACMRLEEVCIRCGLRLPLGGSRLVVAQCIA